MSIDIGVPPTINGRTGEVLLTTVDGEPAKIDTNPAPMLVDLSLEQLAHDLVVTDRKIGAQEEVVTDEKATLKTLKERREDILAAIKRHDDGEIMLPFDPLDQGDEEEPGDDEG